MTEKNHLVVKLSWVGLFLITCLAFGLRFYQVNNLPAALNRDEAAIGYNALLLAQTGLDEWGKPWPLALESFGDYKLPGYVWTTVLFGKIFGWHDWVIRFGSILAGSLLPLAGFYWLKQSGIGLKASLALSLVLAIAPFSWFYSRMAFEANLALTMMIIWLGLLATKKTQLISLPKLSASLGLDLSIIFLVILAILTYNTPLLILPFILIGLPIYFGIKHWRNWLVLWLGLLVVTGSGFYGLSQLFGQKSGITIFSDPAIWAIYVTARPTANLINQNWWGFLSLKMCQNFWSSIGPNFLVSHGGSHPWHSLPDIGHIYWSSYILGWIGLITTFARAMRLSRTKFWLWCQTSQAWWLYLSLISLAPAVITVDAPHATRSLIFLVLTQVWAVIGLTWLWRKVVKFFPNLARLFLISIIAILASETTRYYHAYFSLYPVQQQVFQPGLPETIQKINLISLTDPVAVVGDGYSYINWAWYLKMPAAEFFRTVIKQQPDRIGFKYGQQIGRYHFISNSADRVASEKILVQWQEPNWKIQIF